MPDTIVFTSKRGKRVPVSFDKPPTPADLERVQAQIDGDTASATRGIAKDMGSLGGTRPKPKRVDAYEKGRFVDPRYEAASRAGITKAEREGQERDAMDAAVRAESVRRTQQQDTKGYADADVGPRGRRPLDRTMNRMFGGLQKAVGGTLNPNLVNYTKGDEIATAVGEAIGVPGSVDQAILSGALGLAGPIAGKLAGPVRKLLQGLGDVAAPTSPARSHIPFRAQGANVINRPPVARTAKAIGRKVDEGFNYETSTIDDYLADLKAGKASTPHHQQFFANNADEINARLKTEKPQPTAQPTPRTAPPQPTSTPTQQGLRERDLIKAATDMGITMPQKIKVGWQQIEQEAMRSYDDIVRTLPKADLAPNQTLVPEQRLVGTVRLRELGSEAVEIERQLALEGLDRATREGLETQYGRVMGEADKITKLLFKTSSQDGRNLAFHRFMADGPFDKAAISTRLEKASGGYLSDKQRSKVFGLADRGETVQRQRLTFEQKQAAEHARIVERVQKLGIAGEKVTLRDLEGC